MQRSSGILMHISSLPSPYGIGTMGREAYRFVDFLRQSGTRLWQMLPVGPTSDGNSPYQSLSTFAGNPNLIDLDLLCEEGILNKADLKQLEPEIGGQYVDYEQLGKSRIALLRCAFNDSYQNIKPSVDEFAVQKPWLFDFTFFCALKDRFDGLPWSDWPDDAIRLREPSAMKSYASELAHDIAFYSFVQYLFFKQWNALKSYANKNGVAIFGDMPIYVSMDSSDTWANPELFKLDAHRRPLCVAGVPPDYFSPDGQLWGNPIYNWRQHEKTGYAWWRRRMQALSESFDMLRIDHFIGFANYYEIPAGDATAKNGKWKHGPGLAFFKAMNGAAPSHIVAEDLGVVTPKVKRLREACGYPGMKVLLFAFGSDERNTHLPHHVSPNTVLYTGTHDNDTTKGWWQTAKTSERRFAMRYLGIDENADICRELIRTAFASNADTVVIPMQDHLKLGSESRMNTPGTVGPNWRWRLIEGQLTDDIKDDILNMNKEFDRTGDNV